ncbi:MAG: helix-turn-helix transcriptional regulator [Firmicutes bacterium]|nr:helix-turn-helix transcriptional regulator [Bacillota bacterium]
MDALKIGRYIQHLRKAAGMTQKELAEKLNISFQAVSKWENGDSLPDTGILLDLCDALNTTADKLLNGGVLAASERRLMRLEDVKTGFRYLESIGKLFGEDCTFFTGMIEGINEKMNMDILTYLKDPKTREVMYAEVLIQGILSGRTVDMDEIDADFENRRMVDTIRRYIVKTNGTPQSSEKSV